MTVAGESARLRQQALSVLRGGRCTVVDARCPDGSLTPDVVVAQVRGHRGVYAVDLRDGAWDCTCRGDGPCAHVAAVQLVTGHHGLPAEPGRSL